MDQQCAYEFYLQFGGDKDGLCLGQGCGGQHIGKPQGPGENYLAIMVESVPDIKLPSGITLANNAGGPPPFS